VRLPIQVEAILFRRENGRTQYLLLKRTPEREGLWQPVTGGVEEEEETRIDALKREVTEETGIKDVLRIIEGIHYFEFSDPCLNKEYVYGVEVSADEKIVIDEKEHSGFRWCSLQEALGLMKWKENKEALKKLNGILRASISDRQC
jgi:dATP pyrophosphohydrolase